LFDEQKLIAFREKRQLRKQGRKFLQFGAASFNVKSMSLPLAFVYYSNLLPGSLLVNRLQDSGYRVQSLSGLEELAASAEREMPLLILAELTPPGKVCAAVAKLKANAATEHIPVLAFSATHDATIQAQAREAGVTLLSGNLAIVEHLPQLLDQILQVD
jgi:CheY-like chemotaxis protein